MRRFLAKRVNHDENGENSRAFNSGNLPAVAKALKGKFPDKPIIIAGDNDFHLESQGVNPGKIMDRKAAKAVSGMTIFPISAPGEQTADPKPFKEERRIRKKSS